LKRKNRNLKLGIVGLVVLVAAVIYFNPDFDSDIGTFGADVDNDSSNSFFIDVSESFQFELNQPPTLDFFDDHLDCTYKQILNEKRDGRWYEVNADTKIVKNNLIYNLSGATITDFRTDLQMKCYWPSWVNQESGDGITISGTYIPEIYTGSVSNLKLIKQPSSIFISPVQLTEGSYTTLRSYTFSADDVEDFLILGNNNLAWVHTSVQPAFIITQTVYGVDSKLGTWISSGGMFTSANVKVQGSIITPPDDVPIINTNTMEITSIKTVAENKILWSSVTHSTPNSLDTNQGTGRQIEIIAELQRYHEDEPLPYVKILGKIVVLSFTHMDEDDGFFRGTFFVPQNTGDGLKTVELKMSTRPNVSASAKIQVENIVVTTPTPDDNDPPVLPTYFCAATGTYVSDANDCTSVSAKVGLVQIKYKINYKDGSSTNGITTKQTGADQVLSALSITDSGEKSPSSKDKVIQSIELEPMLSLKNDELKGWRITNANLKFDVGYELNDVRTSMTIQDVPPTFNTITGKDNTNFLSLGKGSVIMANQFDSRVATSDAVKTLSTGQSLPLELDIKLTGTFNVIEDNTNSYQSKTTGASFTYPVHYTTGGSSSNPETIVCNTDMQFRSQDTDGNEVCKNKISGNVEEPKFCVLPEIVATEDGYTVCKDDDGIIIDKDPCKTGEVLKDGICTATGKGKPESCPDGEQWVKEIEDCVPVECEDTASCGETFPKPFGNRSNNIALTDNICGQSELWIDVTNDNYACWSADIGIHNSDGCQDEEARLIITDENEFVCKILDGDNDNDGKNDGGNKDGEITVNVNVGENGGTTDNGSPSGESGGAVMCDNIPCANAISELTDLLAIALLQEKQDAFDTTVLVIGVIILVFLIIIGYIKYKRKSAY
jgi:hypothetical protein